MTATISPERPRLAEPVARRSGVGRIVAAVTALALVAVGIVVWATPVLGLDAVDVVGRDGAQVAAPLAADVRAAVALPSGTPLARIDLTAVQRRIAAVPEIATASVVRQWPHRLQVTVTARVAVATTQANGQWWLLDATGMPFRQLAARPANLMPLQLATPGAGDRATLAALGVLKSLSPQVRGTVSGISAATAYDVTLFLSGGRSVVWGSDSDAGAKNAVIPAITKQPGTVFDVSDPTLVTVTGR